MDKSDLVELLANLKKGEMFRDVVLCAKESMEKLELIAEVANKSTEHVHPDKSSEGEAKEALQIHAIMAKKAAEICDKGIVRIESRIRDYYEATGKRFEPQR